MVIERYSHVMHIVSDLAGTLREDADALDLFAAAFPAGTVTGAPKIRAMQRIDELEPVARGFYAGSVAHIDFDGDMDSCIVLRCVATANGKALLASLRRDRRRQRSRPPNTTKCSTRRASCATCSGSNDGACGCCWSTTTIRSPITWCTCFGVLGVELRVLRNDDPRAG